MNELIEEYLFPQNDKDNAALHQKLIREGILQDEQQPKGVKQ